MALIKQIQIEEKIQIKIPASKNLADKFNEQLTSYQKNYPINSLDFDPLIKKLVNELEKIIDTKI